MATNDLLPFATDNTNVLTQAEYAADAQRTSGNVPGVARAKLVNKAARQSSVVAAGVGQFLADNQATNVTDTLTATAMSTMMTAAVRTAIPAATESTQGKAAIASQTVVDAGTDDTTIVSPKKLKNGFAISLAANGYVKFPSWLGGWIVQWAAAAADITVPAQSSDMQTITFPMAFPNAVFRVFPTVMATSGSRMFGAPFTPTLTNVAISLNNTGTSSGTGRSSLFAIGN
ncbi:hypothetical protein LMG26842_02580 [Achromobacter dolens]|uniref:gp53-like domain-containing protein n=1 Tax=Achromobacter dolens TaxID=1287738 RepID=UPI001466C85D|nr:hypothetical protein [Achromobacter dolens]CAB3845753.1 hypothetical protein LMG26842_02580 [Achromobacter dolens]